MKIQIILGSTRPSRNGEQIAQWAYDQARKRDDFEVELVDVANYNLPLLDEPVPPAAQKYTKEHTKRWSEKINEADGYIFVTAEYNFGVPGNFKNATDYLSNEWNNKSLGFVSYGSAGGHRAVDQWRNIAAQLKLADVREQLALFFSHDFENFTQFRPTEEHAQKLDAVFTSVVSWAKALKTVRDPRSADELQPVR